MVRVRAVSLLILSASLAQVAAAQADKSTYLLGVDDVFSVKVVRHPELSADYLVPPSGQVDVVGVGQISVVGLSLGQIQETVRAGLAQRLRKPEVNVTLKAKRSSRVFVYGDVQKAGAFELQEGWTVAESLSAAGGLIPGVLSRDCIIRIDEAKSGKAIRLRLDEALQRGVKIGEGDVLRIEAVSAVSIYVNGMVKTPGVYKVREDSNGLLEVLSQAGGVLDRAATDSVRIIRAGSPELKVDITSLLIAGQGVKNTMEVQLPKLLPGDVVLVPESLDQVAVLGYVAKPGFYPLKAGREFRLADALAMAQGGDERSRFGKVGIVRQEEGKDVRRVYDLSKFLRNGNLSENPQVRSGDVIVVPETDRVDLRTLLQGIQSAAFFWNAARR